MKPSKHINELIASRRALLGGLAGLPLLNLAGCATEMGAEVRATPLTFASVPATNADTVTVPPGYSVRTLVGWGDALFDDMPAFDPDALTRADQELRWGQNNDMLALFPATHAFPPPRRDARDGDRLILCANNEYAEPALMFPALAGLSDVTSAHIETALAAVGVSIAVLERAGGHWRLVRDAAPGAGFNRRITNLSPMVFAGPAANHSWIRESAPGFQAEVTNAPHEPTGPGAISCGTTANCAGGQTPWGTYLTSEENFNYLFQISDDAAAPLAAARADPAYATDIASFGVPVRQRYSPLFAPRFDLSRNPHAPALYGWVVEIDPYDPSWAPRKRTALGRKKGECATTALTRDGHVAVYSGDDQVNEFLYKFVSRDRFNPSDRLANRALLDDGQLNAARFAADGTGVWLPIDLDAANAAAREQQRPLFHDPGDLMVRAREAARLLGATPMDRPEDVEALLDPNWVGLGPVLVSCTNNRGQGAASPGNPRRESPTPAEPQPNAAGHVLRLDEAAGDCGSTTFSWNVFALCGDPDPETLVADTRSGRPAHVSNQIDGAPSFSGARFACPDNIFIDARFNVWIATDGSDDVFADCNDQLMAAPALTDGPRDVKRFLVGPPGCEITGPVMTADNRTLLVAIQHPGDTDVAGTHISELRWNRGERPPSHWPEGGDAWPRSAVVEITHDGGGKIGD